MPKAYPYIRFSSDGQAKGMSFDRQLERAEAYANAHGLELCEAIKDLGVSAFDGSNANTGELSKFVAKVSNGEIPKGSYLLVESFDRLSRRKPFEALQPFMVLLNADITVVTLSDNRCYSRSSMTGDDPVMGLIVSLVYMARAHDESDAKSKRARDNWARKRKAAAEKKLTARCPAWLRLNDDRKSFSVLNERAALVVEIFQSTADGVGKHLITKKLNERKVPAFGRATAWHASYVSKLLDSRAVLGEYQPFTTLNGTRVEAGDVIEMYYPPIVSASLFELAQAARFDRRRGYSGRKGRLRPNLLSGLCRCGVCSGGMTFRAKGNQEDYLVCDSAIRGKGCANRTHFNYRRLETGILDNVLALSLDFAGDKLNSEASEMAEEIARRKRGADLIQIRMTNLLESMEGTPSKAMAKRLRELEEELDTLNVDINKMEHELTIARGQPNPAIVAQSLKTFRDRLYAEDASVRDAARTKAFQGIHSIVDFILFEPEDRKAYVSIVGGAMALLFKDGLLAGKVDLTSSLDTYGGVPTAAITNRSTTTEARLSTLIQRKSAVKQ